jgi:hypothetical protein
MYEAGAVGIVILSLLLFNPRDISSLLFPLSKYNQVVEHRVYALLWWILLSIFSLGYLTLDNQRNQNFWTYGEGKSQVFRWRTINAVFQIWIIQLIISFSYLFPLYNSFIGYSINPKIVWIGFRFWLDTSLLLTVLYLLISGIQLLARERREIAIIILYLLIEELGIDGVSLRFSKNISNSVEIILVVFGLVLLVILNRLYLKSEVIV